MSEISREIKLLYYLKDHNKRLVKNAELADYLEVSSRQIRRYIEDLNMAGFHIESYTGHNGGFRLLTKLDEMLSLSETECVLLNLSVDSNKKTISFLNEACQISSKIRKNLVLGNDRLDFLNLDFMVNIVKAIDKHKKIEFSYRNYEKKIIIEPYIFLFQHNNYYLRGIENNQMKNYLVKEINEVIITEEDFVLDEERYNQEVERSKNYGIYNNDEFEVKLKLNNVDDIGRYFDYKGHMEGNYYVVKAYNYYEILTPIMSLMDKVEILEPKELIAIYNKQLEKMKELYKK